VPHRALRWRRVGAWSAQSLLSCVLLVTLLLSWSGILPVNTAGGRRRRSGNTGRAELSCAVARAVWCRVSPWRQLLQPSGGGRRRGQQAVFREAGLYPLRRSCSDPPRQGLCISRRFRAGSHGCSCASGCGQPGVCFSGGRGLYTVAPDTLTITEQ